MAKQQTLEQERAARAWRCVVEAKQQNDDFKKKYGTLARKLPSLIQVSGLGQSLAFLRSKGKDDVGDEHTVIYRHLSAWVMPKLGQKDDGQKYRLLEWLIEQPSRIYRRATNEALAFLNWLKRFAEAELPTEEAGG